MGDMEIYEGPEVAFNGKNIINKGQDVCEPNCSIGAAVMVGVAVFVWDMAAVINWAVGINAAGAAFVAVYGVGVDC